MNVSSTLFNLKDKWRYPEQRLQEKPNFLGQTSHKKKGYGCQSGISSVFHSLASSTTHLLSSNPKVSFIFFFVVPSMFKRFGLFVLLSFLFICQVRSENHYICFYPGSGCTGTATKYLQGTCHTTAVAIPSLQVSGDSWYTVSTNTPSFQAFSDPTSCSGTEQDAQLVGGCQNLAITVGTNSYPSYKYGDGTDACSI